MYIAEKYDKQVVTQTFHGKVTANVYVLPTTWQPLQISVTHSSVVVDFQ